MRRHKILGFLIYLFTILIIIPSNYSFSTNETLPWNLLITNENRSPSVYDPILLSPSYSPWSNATIISDDFIGWNNDSSQFADIATDIYGNVHVVWEDQTIGEWGTDHEIMYANYTGSSWSNSTVISDDFTGWNTGDSHRPSIATDSNGDVHVVWNDNTNGPWYDSVGDWEIMYVNYTSSGWSNATVISDDFTGWNDQGSYWPDIAVDKNDNLHVVWEDWTDGEWGTDREIMYVNYTSSGWSNATVISDDFTGWNNDTSNYANIAIDIYGNLHVVWEDFTVGEWGSDHEVMYVNYTSSGWSNATVISDDFTGWNTGDSHRPSVATDNNGDVHVVWNDGTDGTWGTDWEIMYSNNSAGGWSKATVISDDSTNWNYDGSYQPEIAIDKNGDYHVVWNDWTPGEWGTDHEIMYVKHVGTGWTNATVISDDGTGWNNGDSSIAQIATDNNSYIHVVWHDDTDGEWGTDYEIMYSRYLWENNPPTSNHPNNITTPISDTDKIGWILYDDYDEGYYRVWANDTNGNYYIREDWQPWTNNTLLNVTINRTALGIYNYTIEYNDSAGIFGNPDTVIVYVVGNNGSKQFLSSGINYIFQYDNESFLWVNLTIFVSYETNLTITTYLKKPITFEDLSEGFLFFDLTLEDPNAIANVIIRFHYNESLLNGIEEQKIVLYIFNEGAGKWEILDNATSNYNDNYFQVNLAHLSKFAMAPKSQKEIPIIFLPPSGGDNLLLYIIIGGIAITTIAIIVAVKKRKEELEPIKKMKFKKEELKIKRAYDYLGGDIRYKVVVENISKENIRDISVELDVSKGFEQTKPINKIKKLEPGESIGSDFTLTPMTCGKTRIHGKVSYINGKGKPVTTEVSPSIVQIKCPLVQPKTISLSELMKLMGKLQSSHTEIEYSRLSKALAYQIAKEQVSSLDVLEVEENEDIFHVIYSGEAKVGGDLIIIDLIVKDKIIINVYLKDIKQATGFLANIKNLINLAIKYSSRISTTLGVITSKIYNLFEFAGRLSDLNNLCIEKAPVDDILLVLKELNIKSNSYFSGLKIAQTLQENFKNWINNLDQIKDEEIWDRTYLNMRYDIINLIDAIILLSESNSKNYYEAPDSEETIKKNIEIGNKQLIDEYKKILEQYSKNIIFALMVIEKNGGLNLYTYDFKEEKLASDLIGGFLTAIRSFGTEISKEETIMKKLSYEHFQIELLEGQHIIAALFTSGISDQLTKERLNKFLIKFEKQFKNELETFMGDISRFERAKDLINQIF